MHYTLLVHIYMLALVAWSTCLAVCFHFERGVGYYLETPLNGVLALLSTLMNSSRLYVIPLPPLGRLLFVVCVWDSGLLEGEGGLFCSFLWGYM